MASHSFTDLATFKERVAGLRSGVIQPRTDSCEALSTQIEAMILDASDECTRHILSQKYFCLLRSQYAHRTNLTKIRECIMQALVDTAYEHQVKFASVDMFQNREAVKGLLNGTALKDYLRTEVMERGEEFFLNFKAVA